VYLPSQYQKKKKLEAFRQSYRFGPLM
jgi:hypothetical protein